VHNQITGGMSLYKVGPKIYRAGFSLAAPPVELPEGLEYAKFNGGKYSRFALTGPYADLPQASGRVFEIVSENRSNSGMTSALKTKRTIREQRLKSS
jgi:DNA gyrase inhibitor GyrI